MKRLLTLLLAAAPVAAPVAAQDSVPLRPPAQEDGFSLVEEGARMVLRGLMTEMQPTLDEMGRALNEVGPALEGFGEEIRPKVAELIAMIDDFGNYDAPVMLPNGDILIRRNAPLVPRPAVPDDPVPGPNGEIEL
jgi:hypothetical protein